jgi:uncharacterized protein DUF262/uncharacterized protein DUF1524
MPNERLEISRQGIAKLINDGNLCVPPNQREYSWKDEHIIDLYQDLAKAMRDDEPDYFLGSVVMARNNGSLQVFDGQQRLATTVIFLAAIRNYYFENHDTERAGIIESSYLMSRSLQTLEPQPKLTLSKIDHDFFLKRILERDPGIRAQTATSCISHERIQKAAQIADQQIQGIIAPYHPSARSEQLYNWVSFLMDRATVICVQVADDKSAYVVFETMNDRGLRPSAADLLKNHLFGLAGNRLQEAERNWVAMTGALDTVADADDEIVVDYVRHMWISQNGPTRTRELFDRIKENVRSRQDAVDVSGQLAQNAVLYSALLNPAHDLWNPHGASARRHIATLKSLGMKQLRPLLLAGIKNFPPQEIPRFLLTLVCWAVRFLITGGAGSGGLEAHYGRNAQDITTRKIADLAALASAMVAVVPADDAFRSAFAAAQVPKAQLARYYLRALQLKDDGELEPQYVPNDDASDINLEHILPKAPSDEWAGMDADVFRANVNRLGNLVLLQATPNSFLSSSGYPVKRPVLQASAFSLTQAAGGFAAWTPAEIAQRQRSLADLAVQTWSLRP